MQRLLLILGNQLFPVTHVKAQRPHRVYMSEDAFLCTHFRYHQQKLTLVLSAMRAYADALRLAGIEVDYQRLEDTITASAIPQPEDFGARLETFIHTHAVTELVYFEVEGKAMQQRIRATAQAAGINPTEVSSPMFSCSRERFQNFLVNHPKPQMATFYKHQRHQLNILLTPEGEPEGGRWSFDDQNRKKLPKQVIPPDLPEAIPDPHVAEVKQIVTLHFADHPGDVETFWWPTTREGALYWLDDFLHQRLAQFGPFEDALTSRSDTLFHSTLSPLLNLGLLTPDEVVDAAIQFSKTGQILLQSLEGFVRQIIGWREFVRGIHQTYSGQQATSNFWQHERGLANSWYDAQTGITPLDDAIAGALRLGWSHHIPRLMIIANLMTLCEIHPKEAHRWFMDMYVDSASWVMGPNVYGMGLFSDGGIFATKPYICGSNYILKMSDYKKDPWCDIVDGLYWRFIHRNRDFFSGNPRLALMPRALDRIAEERRFRIFDAAEKFIDQHTVTLQTAH